MIDMIDFSNKPEEFWHERAQDFLRIFREVDHRDSIRQKGKFLVRLEDTKFYTLLDFPEIKSHDSIFASYQIIGGHEVKEYLARDLAGYSMFSECRLEELYWSDYHCAWFASIDILDDGEFWLSGNEK